MPLTSEARTIRPFRIEVQDEELADLRRRIAETRWPHQELVPDASQGVQQAMLQELTRYWAGEHDWRTCEARLNELPQFTTEIDGVDIHFIHVRSPHENAMPLIITHGWPGSVIEMLGVVGPLTDPIAHGGRAEDAFHLVLPSLPGFGFSAQPKELGWDQTRTAKAWAELMKRLGYTRSTRHWSRSDPTRQPARSPVTAGSSTRSRDATRSTSRVPPDVGANHSHQFKGLAMAMRTYSVYVRLEAGGVRRPSPMRGPADVVWSPTSSTLIDG